MSPSEKATRAFQQTFGSPPSHIFQAPGRVNLIGEHTDYNDGFVLPCAINFQTVVAARAREDDKVNLVAADYDNELDRFSVTEPLAPHEIFRWANYVRGVFEQLRARGHEMSGVDIAISGNVPQGAGLSSSAALEVVVGTAISSLSALHLSPTDIALIGRDAENLFVGTKCGIMDQLVCAKGRQDHALLIDCRSLETRPVGVPENIAIMILDSHVNRGLRDSDYNERREQCEDAARLLGVAALRDVDGDTFREKQAALPPLLAKRARHVVSENARTLQAAEALERNDLKKLGHLMAASHASMRDDFEITVPPVDALVAIVQQVIGDRGGVRMTGGGFGGCVVALVPRSSVAAVTEAVLTAYETETGLCATIHDCHAVDGAGPLLPSSIKVRSVN